MAFILFIVGGTYGRVDNGERPLDVVHADGAGGVLAPQLGHHLADVLVLRDLPLPEQLARELHAVESFLVLIGQQRHSY